MSVHPHDPAARFERIWAETRDPIVRYLARRAAPDAVEDLFAEVMTVAPGFFTPRIVMQRCSASSITNTPRSSARPKATTWLTLTASTVCR